MKENFNVFDFQLNADDKLKIAALDDGKSVFGSHYDPVFVEHLIGMENMC